MFTDEQVDSMVCQINTYETATREHLIADYCEELISDIPAYFYAKLLEEETDDICRWYEIKALGDLHATEYAELLVSQLNRPDANFGESSVWRILAYSLGKIGECAIPLLSNLDMSDINVKIAIMDSYSKIGSSLAIPYIKPVLLADYSKATVYASNALASSGERGIKGIKEIFGSCDTLTKFALFESLLGVCNDEDLEFVQSIITNYPDFLKKVQKMQTLNYRTFSERYGKY